MSHTKIHHAFTKPVLPSWGVIDVIVEQLAKRARPRLVPEAEVDRFKGLWDAAHDEEDAPEATINGEGIIREDPDASFRRVAFAEESPAKTEPKSEVGSSMQDHVTSMFLPVTQAGGSEVERWLRAAAQAGNAEAMRDLARRLEEQGSNQEAEYWHRKAAQVGDSTVIADHFGSLMVVKNEDLTKWTEGGDHTEVRFEELVGRLAETLDDWSQEIRTALRRCGLTQAKLAKRLGTDPVMVSRRLSGRRMVSMAMALTVEQWTPDVIHALRLQPGEPSGQVLIERLTQLAARAVAAREQLEKRGGRSWRRQAAEHLTTA